MDTRTILEEASVTTGWNVNSMLDIMCEYVNNRTSEEAFRDFVMQKIDAEVALGDDYTPPPLTQEQVASYMNGRWFTPKGQVTPLWIVPTDVDCADVGPDGEILDTLQKACRGIGTLPSDFDYEDLGLEEVPAHARRYNEKDGFYLP